GGRRDGDLPAARALPARQRPFRRDRGEQHVDDLRPRPRYQLRAIEAGLAAAALRRWRSFPPLARVRVPGQALALMPGLPARLAVPPSAALRGPPPRAAPPAWRPPRRRRAAPAPPPCPPPPAPLPPPAGGVPEPLLPARSRRSSSSSRSSSRRRSSRSASSSARSSAFSASLAST